MCFDTGGLDIKAADGMRNMKKDMGGAAHAIALAGLVMARKLPVRLTLLVAAVENAIGPQSYRPGDVVNTRLGVSVEIDNTDAEGRVVLCDALARAAEDKPALLVDFATLTGAARIALGPDLPALYSNDESVAADWLEASERAARPGVAHAAVAAVSALPRQQRRRHREWRAVAHGGQHHRGVVPGALRARRRSRGRTWTCIRGTTRIGRASPRVAKRRDCVRRGRC